MAIVSFSVAKDTHTTKTRNHNTCDMTAIHDEEGMLDIGQHCQICRELDFLPFVCEKCGFTFCSKHRDEYNEHDCDNNKAKEKEKIGEKYDVSKLPKASSVFPDLAKIRREAEINHQIEQGKKIGNRLTNVLNDSDKPMTSIEVAMVRLKKLLKNSSESVKKSNTAKSTSGFFGFGKKVGDSASASRSDNVSKMLDMNQLRRSARGDDRINTSDRIYVWVSYNSDDDKSITIKEGQFFSKRWPIGKMLDSSAKLSKIKNMNNQNVDASLKLAMFRKARKDEQGNEYVYISTSGRVGKEIVTGDHIYILRGKQ